MPSFLSPLLKDPVGAYCLVNERTGGVVAENLVPAFDSRTRRTGLLNHESLSVGTAMIIAPTNAVHTFFMKFAIDVAFVARNGRVVKVCGAVPPWRIAAAWRAFAAIELFAGVLSQAEVRPGDVLIVLSRSKTDPVPV
jgi:uncharacterized protein